MSDNARTGKIARCPLVIREEVNRRLLDGESGPRLIAWLNSQEAVLRILDLYFNEEPITPQNLSEWRAGGYQDWLKRREQLERTKGLAVFAADLAAKSKGTADGNTAIVAGQLLEIFESLDIEAQKKLLKDKPEVYLGLVDALARLEKSRADLIKAEAGRDMVEIQRRRADLAESALKLAQQKFAATTSELFLKFYDDRRAKEIVEGKGDKTVKMEKLRQLMFPELEPLDPTPLNPDPGPAT